MTLDSGNQWVLSRNKGAGKTVSEPLQTVRTPGRRRVVDLSVHRGVFSHNLKLPNPGGLSAAALILFMVFLISLSGCASTPPSDVYHDPAMDFPAIRTVAVLPLTNLSLDKFAAERVRDVLANALLATEAFYVLPSGEVSRGMTRLNAASQKDPSPEEIMRICKTIGADAVITGVVREYGLIRSGSISVNSISLSLKMVEAERGTVVWSASTTKGGITPWIRMFGGGGKPMDEVTREAVEELLDNLFM